LLAADGLYTELYHTQFASQETQQGCGSAGVTSPEGGPPDRERVAPIY
jgi:hypothetical protein